MPRRTKSDVWHSRGHTIGGKRARVRPSKAAIRRMENSERVLRARYVGNHAEIYLPAHSDIGVTQDQLADMSWIYDAYSAGAIQRIRC